jgi:hypothetical protein
LDLVKIYYVLNFCEKKFSVADVVDDEGVEMEVEGRDVVNANLTTKSSKKNVATNICNAANSASSIVLSVIVRALKMKPIVAELRKSQEPYFASLLKVCTCGQ